MAIPETKELIADPVLDLIGGTPLVELTRIDARPARLFVKVENRNLTGSFHDRAARAALRCAEEKGGLKPGSRLVDAAWGGAGPALASVAVRRGYAVTLVVPDDLDVHQIRHLEGLGASLVVARTDGSVAASRALARRFAEENSGTFFLDLFANPAAVHEHETVTGPELWRSTGGALDAVVCGVHSGATLAGLTRFFKTAAPHVEVWAAAPAGAPVIRRLQPDPGGPAGEWLPGGKIPPALPPLCDLTGVRGGLSVNESESAAAVRLLLKREGLLAGPESGLLLAAAIKYGRSRSKPVRVATFLVDDGRRALDRELSDRWMSERGHLPRPRHGDLRDLIARSPGAGTAVTISPESCLADAYRLFKRHEVSQLPVLDRSRLVGILDESDVLIPVAQDGRRFLDKVGDVMTRDLWTVSPGTPLADLLPIFASGRVPLVVDGEEFLGLITQIDVIHYLRRKIA